MQKPLFRQIKPKDATFCPSKERYEAYVHPKYPSGKNKGKDKEFRHMTFRQMEYDNWMSHYYIYNIQPYLREVP